MIKSDRPELLGRALRERLAAALRERLSAETPQELFEWLAGHLPEGEAAELCEALEADRSEWLPLLGRYLELSTAVVVVWSRERHPLRVRFGVLKFHQLGRPGGVVSLREGAGQRLFEVNGPQLRVATAGRHKLVLNATGAEPFYVYGPHDQLSRYKEVRGLIDTYQADLTPPRHKTPPRHTYMSDRQWWRLVQSTNRRMLLFNREARIWRPYLLDYLESAGAVLLDDEPSQAVQR